MGDVRADNLEYSIALCDALKDGPARMEPWPRWGHHSRRGRNDRYKNVNRATHRRRGFPRVPRERRSRSARRRAVNWVDRGGGVGRLRIALSPRIAF